jgi:5'(3')-deoxyribonucleotidase
MEKVSDKVVTIHHDIDGFLRDFHGYAEKLFHEKYPEYKQYQVPSEKIRGWQFEDEYWPLDKAKEVDQLMTELFFGGEFTYNVFKDAPALITSERWWIHVDELKTALPNSRIVLSTHQYTVESKLATIEWLEEREFGYEDLIFSSEKELYHPSYIIDDKPSTIETIHNGTNGSVGVLFKRDRGNGWYRRDNPNIPFLMVDTIEQFRAAIIARENYIERLKLDENFGK